MFPERYPYKGIPLKQKRDKSNVNVRLFSLYIVLIIKMVTNKDIVIRLIQRNSKLAGLRPSKFNNLR